MGGGGVVEGSHIPTNPRDTWIVLEVPEELSSMIASVAEEQRLKTVTNRC